MRIEIKHKPSYALGILHLKKGESAQAEAGAMVSMSPSVEIHTKATGGVMKSLKRQLLGGESFFVNTFEATSDGELTVAPSLPGDIVHHKLDGTTLMVQSGSYIASTGDVDVDTKWGGAKTFFSREGLFLLRVSGTGHLLVSSFGAVHELQLGEGESYIVDSGHVVAFEESVGYDVRRMGNWKSTFFSGEGLVVELTGPGTAYLQTRSPDALLNWLIPKMPKSSEK